MKILVIGGGGREHALCWKIRQSRLVDTLYCAPGNAGTAEIAENVDIKAEDLNALLGFAKSIRIDLTVVGPEAPLAKGIVDLFESEGLTIFGANQQAAMLEASKAFTKRLLAENNIPTADFAIFTEPMEAWNYLSAARMPTVIKADGLAAGKGVIICYDESDCRYALKMMMDDKAFGSAGETVVIEDYIKGEEASFLAFVSGEQILPMLPSQDHKAVYDNDQGPNTGGMGAYAPAPLVDDAMGDKIMEQVMSPLVTGLCKKGIEFKGVLYAGLKIYDGTPHVLEFNVRFGDPECQPLMMLLKSDLVEAMLATIEGRLDELSLEWKPGASTCVVAASKGYPGKYQKDKLISGLDLLKGHKDLVVFHAGTKKMDNKVVTAGGRVLGITSYGDDIRQAREKAYQALQQISFEGMHYRRDIGAKA